MGERAESKGGSFRLVEAPGKEVRGLVINRSTNSGFTVGYVHFKVISVEPDCWLVEAALAGKKNAPGKEQVLKWNTPYNLQWTKCFLEARVDLGPALAYPSAIISVEAPKNVPILRDKLRKKMEERNSSMS